MRLCKVGLSEHQQKHVLPLQKQKKIIMADSVDVYMNRPQRMAHIIGAHDERGVASRRVGKSEHLGDRQFQVVKSLPGGKSAFGGVSRAQVMMKTWPSAKTAMARFYGLKEGTHFGAGKPPSWVPKPINDPDKRMDSVWFANGHIMMLLSAAQVGSGNSYTFDHISWDECRFTKKEKMYSEVLPANSGETHPFGDPGFSSVNPYYRGTCLVSDAALTLKTNWLEEEESILDTKPIVGPFTDMTYRQIQEELEQFAKSVIKYNDLIYYAKKEGKRVIEVSPEKKVQIEALYEAVTKREGPYKIIPRQYGADTKGAVDYLVNYKLLSAEDGELLYSHKYLITKKDQLEMMKLNIPSNAYLKRIQQLRSWAFYCWRASTLQNADVVGFEYIASMYRDLSPGLFSVSILNEKKAKANEGFYTNLDIENIHGYIPDDAPCIDKSIHLATSEYVKSGMKYKEDYETYDFARLGKVDDCTQDGDVIDALPLHIAFDYNANITTVVTGQMQRRDGIECLCVLGSMYALYERKIHALVEDWNRYYAPHRAKNRTVYYYYDATAKFRGYAIEKSDDFKDTIIADLRKYGWDVVGIDMGTPMLHHDKWRIINEALGGFSSPGIRINQVNNEELIIAMQMTEIRERYNGTQKTISKNKSGEKLADTEDGVPLQNRTDITDAFDSLFIGVKMFRFRTSLLMTPNGK